VFDRDRGGVETGGWSTCAGMGVGVGLSVGSGAGGKTVVLGDELYMMYGSVS